jgi:hypothetical protein
MPDLQVPTGRVQLASLEVVQDVSIIFDLLGSNS